MIILKNICSDLEQVFVEIVGFICNCSFFNTTFYFYFHEHIKDKFNNNICMSLGRGEKNMTFIHILWIREGGTTDVDKQEGGGGGGM